MCISFVVRKGFKHLAGSVLCGLVAFCATGAEAEQIKVAGSSTVKPILDKATAAYQKNHSETQFVVGAGGSSQGVLLAGKKEVQIGMASRDLKAEEKSAYADLKATKIGLDGIAIVVHADNLVKQITGQQVVDVYTGKITNWKQLGGQDAPIVLISVSRKHGTFDGFIEHFKLEAKGESVEAGKPVFFKMKSGGEYSAVSAATFDGNKPALAAVMTQPNAIGFASLGTTRALGAKGSPIRALDLDGVAATEDNVIAGKYPFRRNLYVLTNGAPTGEVEAFIKFLTGDEGQAIVKSLDFIVAPAAQ